MKRNTANRRHQHRNVLEVRVMSPRIAWFGFLRFLGVLARFACLAAVLAGIGWGVWRGIQHAFYQNPDFSLRKIDLNPNPVTDEAGLAEILGLDLTSFPSLFEIDVDDARSRLLSLPAVTDAQVERHLPDRLVVRLAARTPKAWIRCRVDDTRRVGGLLVDFNGIAYPCPEMQFADAAALPVIELPGEAPEICRKIEHASLDHCFRLLKAARSADPAAVQWVDSIRQANDWSLELVTREGTRATFGLGDHERQIRSLRNALDHAASKGYVIDTINLIPKYNIPITVRDESAPPKAVVVKPARNPDPARSRQARDLDTLLERN